MSGNVKESVRLCEHIVRQAFGDVVCRVASTLLNRGRLPVPSLSSLSALSRSSTLASILILMQHNLVLSNGASVQDQGEEEQYEFDVQACLMRLRWGRILAITGEKLGIVAVEIIQQLMVFGRLKVGDIVSNCGGNHDPNRSNQLHELAVQLVKSQLIEPTRPELQVLEKDQVERRFHYLRRLKLTNKSAVMLSVAELDNALAQAKHETLEERKKWRDIETVLVKSERQASKKKKIKGTEEFDFSLNPNIALRVNYERYNILIRDELIVKAAEDRWNKGAAEVMRAVMAASLSPDSSLADIRTFNAPGYNEILDRINVDSHPVLIAGIAGFSSSSSSSSKAIPEIVRQYLRILAEADAIQPSGNQFLTINEGGRSYTVELERIGGKLRETLLQELVKEKVGEKATRILTAIMRGGKLSEQHVRDYAMIQLKDARHHLSELQKLSLIETQEVPKTANKSRLGLPPSAEWHFWHIDLPRVYSLLVAGVYKTLGNLLERRDMEVEKRRLVLLRETGGGRDRLQAKDQEDLAELDDTRRKLSLAEMRSDMVVFVLRDMPGWPGKV